MVMVGCSDDLSCVCIQARKHDAVIMSTVYLNLPDASGVPLAGLGVQSIPFTLKLEQLIDFQDLVKEFGGVIGQDGDLLKVGDYVELSSASCEVNIEGRG